MGELTSQNTAAGQGKNQKLIDNINLIDHFLTREILVPADMRKVFEFFSNAQNLELITPKKLNFKKWIHTHSFETKEDGIMIKDEVRYRLPFFPLGELMFLAVRHQLNRIFDYRTTRIKEIFQEANQKNR